MHILPGDLWIYVGDFLPSVQSLRWVRRDFGDLWSVTVTDEPAALRAAIHDAEQNRTRPLYLTVHAHRGDADVPFVRTHRRRRRYDDDDDDDDDDGDSESGGTRSVGDRLTATAACRLRELTVCADNARFTRDGVYHLTHIFEGSLPSVRSIRLFAAIDPDVPHRGRMRRGYVTDLYVWMIANQIQCAGRCLTTVEIDLSGHYLKVPFLRPIVGALARHTGVRSVVIRMRQTQFADPTDRGRRRRYVDGMGDRIGAHRWGDLEPDLRRLVCEIPHLRSVSVDCTGVVGMFGGGRRLADASKLERCTIVPGCRKRKGGM
jgi:hypothetical protein